MVVVYMYMYMYARIVRCASTLEKLSSFQKLNDVNLCYGHQSVDFGARHTPYWLSGSDLFQVNVLS